MQLSPEQWKDFYGKVWDILSDNAGALPVTRERERFVQIMVADDYPCTEFRFQGKLGFGGKIYRDWNKLYVACYIEDETAKAKKIVEATNKKLAELQQKTIGGPIYGSPGEHNKVLATLIEHQQEEKKGK